jgi:hypothetical protein
LNRSGQADSDRNEDISRLSNAMKQYRAGNWIDRGEPAQPHLSRILVRFLELDPEDDATALAEHSETILAFVAADGSEVQLADYLANLQRRLGREVSPGRLRRYVAVALWHIAKAALLRDAVSGQPTEPATSEHTPLSEWLAERLLRDDI